MIMRAAMKMMMLPVLFLVFFSACGQKTAEPREKAVLGFEKQGDAYFAMCNEIRSPDEAVKNIDLAAKNYLKAFKSGKPDAVRLFKYIKARDFKYRFLYGTTQQRKAEYERLIKKYEPLNSKFSNTKEFNYSMAVVWASRGEITRDTFDMSNKEIAEKIKKYGEALYGMDKSFEDYSACRILGRLHYIAPAVPLILPWPDREKSKSYLEEAIKYSPVNTEAVFFLADTIWDMGDKKRAEKLFKQVRDAEPRKDFWYYDVWAAKQSAERMKKLGI